MGRSKIVQGKKGQRSGYGDQRELFDGKVKQEKKRYVPMDVSEG
jgi:hypothetical protein